MGCTLHLRCMTPLFESHTMPFHSLRPWLCSLLWLGLPVAQAADAPAFSGEKRFNATCAKCHARGLNGAPRAGDKAAWGPLVSLGQVALTARAWVGVRDMPPKGGNRDLGLAEFTRAVAYMARQGGAAWKEDPGARVLQQIQAEIAKAPAAPD